MQKQAELTDWLTEHWVAAALCMGIVLLLLAPVLTTAWDLPALLIYLQMPIYMLHQVEEHTGDRFRTFVNQHAYGGVEVLTPAAILWINIPGVWGVTLLSLYAAIFFGTAWGLAGVYLVLVNAVVHLAAAIGLRSYNPGLWTSLTLFLPVSIVALWRIAQRPGVSAIHHAVGLGIALAIHAAIVIHGRIRANAIHAHT